jgi:chorismate mutase-like protein
VPIIALQKPPIPAILTRDDTLSSRHRQARSSASVVTHPLAPLRDEIDALDDRIIALLAERMAVAHRVALRKRELGIPVVIPERIGVVLDRNAAQGAAAGLDPDYVRRLYREIIDETCRVEEALIR